MSSALYKKVYLQDLNLDPNKLFKKAFNIALSYTRLAMDSVKVSIRLSQFHVRYTN